ncbi:GAF modulated transcriptional regulator, LuxR family [[Leptolyngbya] sp. PCC 7376]|uniref:LuxR C-terminal-related transcriptional regulator n=1 Tax=[Leptolyngbya] sp. PCC 7376 TaxID=111781 RepID=UPI00029F1106|nr:LuxR C-terminal-related transcriptional regulator [[Leptolyngbya] sp. PCC 7376]AFY37856.1 GAF modulated transcriptional regulator, LuxR family [[Leptolyngbya] sp. PCC 7376]
MNTAQLIFDLQKVNAVIQRISGCLDTTAIATTITEALIQEFQCVFARIWLTEPDGQMLKLVSSSGLHTRTDGDFALVPVGAYKVGKIAATRMPFLSNNLASERWVKDRDWAIANGIRGFAGYPLARQDKVIGVLAAFGTKSFVPEFLEVLQVLCMAVTIAVDAAQQAQRSTPSLNSSAANAVDNAPLSDVLSGILTATNLSLIGTERPLTTGLAYLLLRTTEILNQFQCGYCRLTYGDRAVTLEGIISLPELDESQFKQWRRSQFGEVEFLGKHLDGELTVQMVSSQQMTQVTLTLSYPNNDLRLNLNANEKPLLSERERQVLTLLTDGLRDKAIAQQLFISESTVKFHLNSIMGKLKAKNRYQTIYQAAIQGLI